MIEARLARDASGRLCGLRVDGHAGAAARGAEFDLVCAAVSALAQTALLGIEERLGLQPPGEVAPGHLAWHPQGPLPERAGERLDDLLQVIRLGLQAIEREHPRHLRVRIEPWERLRLREDR